MPGRSEWYMLMPLSLETSQCHHGHCQCQCQCHCHQRVALYVCVCVRVVQISPCSMVTGSSVTPQIDPTGAKDQPGQSTQDGGSPLLNSPLSWYSPVQSSPVQYLALTQEPAGGQGTGTVDGEFTATPYDNIRNKYSTVRYILCHHDDMMLTFH
jgi:hypothetical protein